MIKMTDDNHSRIVGKLSHLKGKLDALHSKYRMLRGSGDFAEALLLAEQCHTDLIAEAEPCTECEEPTEEPESDGAPR